MKTLLLLLIVVLLIILVNKVDGHYCEMPDLEQVDERCREWSDFGGLFYEHELVKYQACYDMQLRHWEWYNCRHGESR